MEYTVVRDINLENFIQGVNRRLQERWELYGNLSLAAATRDQTVFSIYAQAMIRRQEAAPPVTTSDNYITNPADLKNVEDI